MCPSQSSIQGVEGELSEEGAQSRGDSRQEALEGPVRPGMQLSSLCEEGSDQPIRNQGSITTRHRAGLRASAVAVSTGGASRGGFSTQGERRASGASTVAETSSRSPTVEVDRQADREADPR